ncbi:trehalose operon repressor [Bacillus sp. N1-1]|jgi:GntR family transcriptional regulator, trehalose operon transcriptional repressor|uniref:trehalose operon repressor n=1 Tax=Bacillus sp. N1-1 TaxID=2682541 RepID=UPI001316F60F|nr:trehalose operon repressor [Bacillus sp. N1-1]QHA91396.1 trehalose operon repressor [Bacillus sp. N1-1]
MKQTKYQQIYNDLSENIRNGTYKPNSKLPSEHDLAEIYGTSRETIRKALNLLSQNGMIQKIKARGSVVLDLSRYEFPVSGLVSFKEISEQMNRSSRTIVHHLEKKLPEEWIREQLELEAGAEVWHVLRAREIEGEKIILDRDFFSAKWVPELTRTICENSIYDYLENDLGLSVSYAKKEIVVEEADEEDRRYLDLHDYKHVVVVRNYVYLNDTTLIEYTESRHRLDKFRFVDFARREKQ